MLRNPQSFADSSYNKPLAAHVKGIKILKPSNPAFPLLKI